MKMVSRLFTLSRNCSGIAVVEFALCLPFVVLTTMAAAELTNFTTTKMRISQLALQIADNASRIGTGTVLSNKTISEKQINDILTGANLQAAKLGLFANGRIILSSLQPGAATNTYIVKWQRCKGAKNFTSTNYYTAGATERSSDPANAANPYKVTPPPSGAVMFVEISYNYQPLIGTRFQPFSEIRETAAMTVRDNRDYAGGTSGIYNTENAPVASCSTFSAT
ncbi:TadE family protein [Sphingobium sp. AN558]|uniref:TadE/TadG family type IV pilus assembly protein n=1 Tax=Sphingobium sp. AN558 TaxID=3133442 RepID=UPI0030BE0819